MYAFISYQTDDKHAAGEVKALLEQIGIKGFLAHEDINVSEEWRAKILEEIGKANIFVSIWSENYYKSWWCIQESGIASFRNDMTIIPLSLDGSIPQGFAGNIQSTKVEAGNIVLHSLIPGIVKANFTLGIKAIYKIIKGSRSYRGAESNFQLLLPYIHQLTPELGKEILEISLFNNQIHDASLCATEYLPPLMEQFGGQLEELNRHALSSILARYVE